MEFFILAWCNACVLSEDEIEPLTAVKTAKVGDIGDGMVGMNKQFLRPLNTQTMDDIKKSGLIVTLQNFLDMGRADAKSIRQLCFGNIMFVMIFNVVVDLLGIVGGGRADRLQSFAQMVKDDDKQAGANLLIMLRS